MSKSQSLERILGQAEEKEKKYDWLTAAESYKKSLDLVINSKDYWKAGEIQERVGYCFDRAAFQAETQEEFNKHMKLSIEAYEKSALLFDKVEDSKKYARIDCCRGKASYNRAWIVESPLEKRTLLDKCWKLEKEALKAFNESGDRLGQGKTCNELLCCLYDRRLIEWDRQQLNKIVDEAVGYGETAIAALSEVRNEQELARAYSLTSLHCFYAANISELEKSMKEFSQKCLNYAQKGLELSNSVGDSYLIGLSSWAASTGALYFSGNMATSLEYAEKMLQQGMSIKENYLIGVACYQLAFTTNWMMTVEEDPDKKREGYDKAVQYAEKAIRHLNIITSDYFAAQTPLAETYFMMALEVDTNREEKRLSLEKSVGAGRKTLEHAERSRSPDAVGANRHELSKALYSLSKVETDATKKKKLLEEASKHRQGYIDIVEKLYPSNYWVRGVGQNYQALIKSELAEIQPEKEKKIELLEEAASNMSNCLKLIEKWAKLYPQTRIFAILGGYYYWFGGILNQLYQLTEDKKLLKDGIQAYIGAVNAYNRAELPSRLAEAHWNIAKLHDSLDGHVKASENFESAAEAYKASAEKIQRLNEFYSDYATYMQAWSQIENAKLAHKKEEYAQSAENYKKAANYLESSKLWRYLSSNFLAWAHLENAENLSRLEKSKESMGIFRQASELFAESKSCLEENVSEIESPEEKEYALKLSKASGHRKEHCLARAILEEARVDDKKGDHPSSAKKYGLAANKFEKIVEALEVEFDRREIRPIVHMCRACEKMKLAEARVSPELYLEASELFLEAKEHSISDRTSLVSMGNSAFCIALECGTRFQATRDSAQYAKAKQQLESASNYYMKAGYESASLWTSATEVLFDAFIYMDKAEIEVDPEKKPKLYLLAERCLERAASLYEKAGYVGKRDEVFRSLGKVKEKRKFALSLGEVLEAPSVASSTAGIFVPTLTHERPVGLERFERADIQANLVSWLKEIAVGEDLDLEIELVNTGKCAAMLIRIEDVVPQGFELVKRPGIYRVEDGHLNMKGKKMNPLDDEEVRFALRASRKGEFSLKPRIVYQDEAGENRFHEVEPVMIKVKELGIMGWLRGPRR